MESKVSSVGRNLKGAQLFNKLSKSKSHDDKIFNSLSPISSINSRVISMRSETQPIRKIDENDREGRIHFALDMVVQDLKARQGKKGTSRAVFLLSSPKLREQVGRLCDEMTRKRQLEQDSLSPSLKCQRSKSVKNIKIITPPIITPQLQEESQDSQKNEEIEEEEKRQILTSFKFPLELSFHAKFSGRDKKMAEKAISAIKIQDETSAFSTSSTLDNKEFKTEPMSHKKKTNGKIKKKSPKRILKKTEVLEIAPKQSKNTSINNKSDDILSAKESDLSRVIEQRYKVAVNLTGFPNESISLDLDGRRIIIVAFKAKDRNSHATKVTEIIEIPKEVNLKHLIISREGRGPLIIEEVDEEMMKEIQN